MAPHLTFQHTLHGYLVGPIWWPVGEECSKPLAPMAIDAATTLRDALSDATNDGDFQHCCIGDGYIETVATIHKPDGRTYRRTRMTALEDCKSVADMVASDWAGPAWCE